jgi:hypothetical protein
MKFHGLAPLVFLLPLGFAQAQVTVEVKLDQEQFLQGESLPVAVRIVNRSGQTLRMGEGQDWLSFSLEGREGEVVPKLGDVPVEGEFLLESSQAAIKHVDLSPYFTLSGPGRYGIVAAVKIRDWGRQVESSAKYFDIVDGSKLWEQVVGVPEGADKTSTMPEVRRYILQQANYIKGQLRLYLRVTDSTGHAIRVYNIGPMLSFSRPEPQVDKHSHLHVLYQKGPGLYVYNVFDLDGKILTHQSYEYFTTRPRLKLDDDGNVSVAGGSRRVAANDIPPPTPQELDQATKLADNPPTPPPAQTNSAKAKKK